MLTKCILKCDFCSSLFIISFSMVDYPIFVRTSHPSTILPVEVALCLTGYFRSVKCEHNSVKKGALTLFGWYFLSIPTTRWQHTYPVLAKRHPIDDLDNIFSTLIKDDPGYLTNTFLSRSHWFTFEFSHTFLIGQWMMCACQLPIKREIVKLSRWALSQNRTSSCCNIKKREETTKFKSESVQPCRKGICNMSWIFFRRLLLSVLHTTYVGRNDDKNLVVISAPTQCA